MRFRLHLFLLLCSFFFFLFFLGCFSPSFSSFPRGIQKGVQERVQSSKRERVFNFRVLAEPETLDWNRAHTPIETHLLVNLMEGLVFLDSKLQPSSGLAESWKVSPDGRTYTFQIRRGVKWSDGVPLQAEDFVYSWKRLLAPSTAAPYAYFLYDIEGAEAYSKGLSSDFSQVGITALDPFTLRVKLIHPVAYWIYIPTYWVTFPLRRDLVEKYGPHWVDPGNMVTLGPYVLKSHSLESKFVLDANPYYYGKRGNVNQLVGWIINDNATALNLYEAGQLDFLGDISTLDLHHLEGRADLKTFPYLKTVYLGFLTQKPPTDDKNLRKAIAMSINRDKMGEILHGGQSVATSLIPPPLTAYSRNLGISYNPSAAKQLLHRAGVDNSHSLHLELLVLNTDKSMILSQFIQNELKNNLNIDLDLQPFDNKTFRSRLKLKISSLFLLSWSADYPDPDTFISLFMSQSGNNHTGWKSSSFDQGVMKAREYLQSSSLVSSEREELYFRLQRELLENEVVLLPLFYEPNRVLVRSRVKNLELNPMNYLTLKKVNLD